jgi:hypothetical protein
MVTPFSVVQVIYIENNNLLQGLCSTSSLIINVHINKVIKINWKIVKKGRTSSTMDKLGEEFDSSVFSRRSNLTNLYVDLLELIEETLLDANFIMLVMCSIYSILAWNSSAYNRCFCIVVS